MPVGPEPAGESVPNITRRICPILRMLVRLLDAPFTVKSLETTATSRPSMRAYPAILPSAGVFPAFGITDSPRSPDSM